MLRKEMNMTVEISREKNKFGNCLKLANNQVEILAAIDYGPRIVSFRQIDGENLFFEDVDEFICNKNKEIEKAHGKGKFWKGKGGHRFWIAPEKMPFTYYPDDAPVNYEIQGNILRLFQPQQVENGIQLTIELMMEEDVAEIKVNHIVKNTSNCTMEIAPWAVTVMAKGGIEIIPRTLRQEEFLPTMSLVIWPYTDLQDDRITFGNEYIVLKQMEIDRKSGIKKGKFKIGISNEEGWAAYINKGLLFKKEFMYDTKGNYPDYGASYETYTDDHILEMESLGCLKILGPGEETMHEEMWSIHEIPNKFEKIGG